MLKKVVAAWRKDKLEVEKGMGGKMGVVTLDCASAGAGDSVLVAGNSNELH